MDRTSKRVAGNLGRVRLWLALLLLLSLFNFARSEKLALAQQPDISPEHAERMKAGLSLFKGSVGAILRDNCLKCHNAKAMKADFDLSTRQKLVASGHLGTSSADSYLMQLVRHTEQPHMPLKAAKLTEGQIEALAKWIDLGAPYDQPLGSSESEQASQQVTADDREFWSFAPLQRSELPEVDDHFWCRTDIDRFILARLENANVRPNLTAQRKVLIRRAYFDLVGLPPHPREIEQFVTDPDPRAYERLVDRLLTSPHYGERWARHWLDVARFAESSGFEHDDDRPHAYHYRDFVIKALNSDLPFDDFIRWQLAGDELAPENALAASATGFLGAGVFPTQLTETEFETARYDELDDMVTNTGLAFLGLSIGCARCHDHKYDPIPASDYYAMAATFAKTVRSEIDLVLEPATSATKVQVTADGFEPIKNHAHGRGYPYFYEEVYTLRRGDVQQKEAVAKQGFVQVLMRNQKKPSDWKVEPPERWERSEFRRAALANWMTDTEHGSGPLAARVIVNRLWQHHFGRGLVATPNDFGMQGERPSHPKLLDWLACELVAHDWSLKRLHKLIMTSSVYMQDDSYDEYRASADRNNELNWRRTPRRLEAEAIRDAMLSVSGQLDTRMYGPGTLDESMRRRSIYFTIKRSKLIPTMMLFDWPEHLVSIGQRPVTTTAPQALLFMNNRDTRALAEAFAQRLAAHAVGGSKAKAWDVRAAIERAYWLAYGRAATAKEASLAAMFLQRQCEIYEESNSQAPEQAALTDFAQMILSGNEFVFIR